jgi:DNA-binding NarL/FixJ family response regulator
MHRQIPTVEKNHGSPWTETLTRSRLAIIPQQLTRSPGKTRPPTPPPTRAKVIIVCASPVTRVGLAAIICSNQSFVICAETDNSPAARELFLRHKPDLVVLGLTLRQGDGIALIKELRTLHPAARTLVVTRRADALAMQRAFRAGARGYLLAGDDAAEILLAMTRILEGERYASERVATLLLEALAGGVMKVNGSKITSLSDRELQVFSLFGRGLGATRLAAELHLSVKTIETHQMRIKEKLGLQSAAELSSEASLWMSEVARREFAASR